MRQAACELNMRRYRLLFWLVLAIVTALALLPLAKPVVPLLGDKMKHALAFFTLALLAQRGWRGVLRFPALAAWLMLYGLCIECAQYFIPNRCFSGRDLVADAAGLALCGAFSYLPVLLSRHSDPD